MEAIEIVENVLSKRKPYDKVAYLLKCYADLKNGKALNPEYRSVLDLLDQAIAMIQNDEYIEVLNCLYLKGYSYEQTAETLGIDKKTVYRQRKRLIKRLAIIIYGDRAL